MSFSMAGGSYSYNRFNNFDKLVEGAKPDFLDMDKDGNKKESFKKAVKDKEKGGEQKECTCKEWVESLLDEGYDLSEYTWDDMERMFEQSQIQYPKGPKMSFTKSKKDPKVAAGREAAKKMGLKMNEHIKQEGYEQIDEISKNLATRAYANRRTNEFEGDELHTKSDKTHSRIVKKFGKKAGEDADKAANKKIFGKESVTKEDVMQHLMDEGFVSNEVSAEVLFNHMSDDWLMSLETAIVEGEGMHRDAKTGEVVKKAEIGKTYYPNMPKRKTSVAIRKEKG